jgi:hypothetical protein
MNVFAIILFASPVLLLVLVAVFVLIVVGIRQGDRGDLATPPRNRIDAISRRVAGVGVRKNADHGEGEG